MKRPLDKCCNGCNKPPRPPSLVLCEDCFAALDKKMHALLGKVLPPRTPDGGDNEGGTRA